MTLPLAITLGDPAGIGPEVAAKLVTAERWQTRSLPPVLLVGPRWALEAGAAAAGVTLPAIPPVSDIAAFAGPLGIVEPGESLHQPADFVFGRVQPACGEVAVQAVEWAARHCLGGTLAAMVTCPLNKAAIHAAGYVNDLGHQEILARLSGAEWTATMLMTPGLRVAHLSTHKSLIEAARYVTAANVTAKLTLLHDTLVRWGLTSPRVAVAALNPHGGEDGLLGREEIEELAPAVASARARGWDVQGPIPADSVFNRAIDGEFDVVLALYHDQGHIAIKVHDFHASTTATLGIPFVRTSVDHGTAFDIAGRGVANPQGLEAAVDVALAIVRGDLGSAP